jgi:HupE / UreJ protein
VRHGIAALAAAALLATVPAAAGAHSMPTSSVLLDIGKHEVGGEIELPLDRLAVARQHPITAAQAAGPERASLEAYVAKHVAVTGKDGSPWTVRLGRSSVKQISGAPALVVPLDVTPPGGRAVTDFKLHYDVILEQLVTHRALVSVRTDFRKGIVSKGDAKPVGIFDWDHQTLTVPASGGSWWRGMVAAAGLGVEHVSTGSDHLLFLLMLLLPAPLVAVGGRWRRGTSGRRSAVRVVHVVSAFAVGHSTTLVLAGLGVLHVPSRPVETLIAASIAISALHAIRPLVARAEVLIAAGFGLVHGLAFASALGELGLTRGSLVSSLFGFNIGIEVTQLLVVALMMPSLLVLARTTWYTPFRLTLAGAGCVFATSWLLERATITSSDPFLPLTEWLVDHPFVITASVAALALVASAAGRERHHAAATATA